MRVEEFARRLEALRCDRSNGITKPYKPLLVASILILIGKGKIGSPYVFLDGALRSVFDQLLAELYPAWPFKADIRYPFRHLETDGLWTLVAPKETASSFEAAQLSGAGARELLRFGPAARIDDEVFAGLQTAEVREGLLDRIAAVYLPAAAGEALRRALGQPLEIGRAVVSPAADLSERAVEEHLFQHWEDTPFAEIGIELSSVGRFGLAGRQVVTPVSNIDLLGYQPVLKKWWVIELKRGVTADAAVGQVSRYLGWVAADRGPRGETAVGVVLTDRVDAKLRYAVAANPLLSLWLYDEAICLRRDEP